MRLRPQHDDAYLRLAQVLGVSRAEAKERLWAFLYSNGAQPAPPEHEVKAFREAIHTIAEQKVSSPPES